MVIFIVALLKVYPGVCAMCSNVNFVWFAMVLVTVKESGKLFCKLMYRTKIMVMKCLGHSKKVKVGDSFCLACGEKLTL